jgi:hypothetical protein
VVVAVVVVAAIGALVAVAVLAAVAVVVAAANMPSRADVNGWPGGAVTAATGRVLIGVDVSDGTDQDQERKDRYKAPTLPAVVFLDSEGNRLAHVKQMLEAEEMLKVLRPAIRKLKARAQTP